MNNLVNNSVNNSWMCWSNLSKKKNYMFLEREFVIKHQIEDECILALIFGYPSELKFRLFDIVSIKDIRLTAHLFSKEVNVSIDSNGSILIKRG